jgi:hypothetical protein
MSCLAADRYVIDRPPIRPDGRRTARCAECSRPVPSVSTRPGSPARPLLCGSCRQRLTRTLAPRPIPTRAPSRSVSSANPRSVIPRVPVTPRVPLATHIASRPAALGLRTRAPGAELVPVRCFRCGRRGLLSPSLLLSRSAQQILCPNCRGTSVGGPRALTPATARPRPSVTLPAALLPPVRRATMVGRPPLLLLRSKLPVPTQSTPGPALSPNGSGTVAVICSQCGRAGRITSALRLSLGPGGVLCPTCRNTRRSPVSRARPRPNPSGSAATPTARPPAAPWTASPSTSFSAGRRSPVRVMSSTAARGALPFAGSPKPRGVGASHAVRMFAVRCFVCGRAGRLPIRPEVSLRPEDVICPTCRNRVTHGTPRGRPRAIAPVATTAAETSATV